ncbi:MAG: ATP-binding cassette domain-containing protein [Coriobacteriia bacterium]|nr:ATP-binding cassette domain-containing protein [Coriobacteriia bacterium]
MAEPILHVDIQNHLGNFDLDVAFECGNETLGILGASGCGKSMTMRSIAGITTPDTGIIRYGDEVLFDSEKKINVKPQKRHISYLFQSYQLFPNMTVMENVLAGMPADRKKEENKEKALEFLKFFQIEKLEKHFPANLSGGQQQRVALARMFASEPKALMLDEPFSALDSHLKTSLYPGLLNALKTFKGPKLYVSHDIGEAYMFCDRMIVLDNGGIVEEGTSAEVIHNPQSLAALKLTGVRNIARVNYVDDHTLKVQESDITFKLDKKVSKDSKYVGVSDGAIKVHKEAVNRPNTYEYELIYINMGAYDEQLIFKLYGIEATTIADEAEKDMLDSAQSLKLVTVSRTMADSIELSIGEKVYLEFPAEDLVIVNH